MKRCYFFQKSNKRHLAGMIHRATTVLAVELLKLRTDKLVARRTARFEDMRVSGTLSLPSTGLSMPQIQKVHYAY